MGYYIDRISNGEVLPSKGKLEGLLMDGAEELDGTPEFKEDLVCVISNVYFDAAMYVYSKEEYDYITKEDGYRSMSWVTYPHAAKMSNFPKSKPKFKGKK